MSCNITTKPYMLDTFVCVALPLCWLQCALSVSSDRLEEWPVFKVDWPRLLENTKNDLPTSEPRALQAHIFTSVRQTDVVKYVSPVRHQSIHSATGAAAADMICPDIKQWA